MKNKKLTYLFVALVIVIGGSVVWYFFFRDDCDPNNVGYTKKGKLSDKCVGNVNDPKNTNETAPSGTTWVSDATFPIKKGSWGSKVKALQKALGITDDGRFYTVTESALQAKTGKIEVSTQAEYDNILNPPATGGGSNYTKLKENLGALAKNFSGGVYSRIQGQNKTYDFNFYTNGRFAIFETGVKGEIAKGTYIDGGKKMFVDGMGDAFNQGGVTSNMLSILKERGL